MKTAEIQHEILLDEAAKLVDKWLAEKKGTLAARTITFNVTRMVFHRLWFIRWTTRTAVDEPFAAWTAPNLRVNGEWCFVLEDGNLAIYQKYYEYNTITGNYLGESDGWTHCPLKRMSNEELRNVIYAFSPR